MITTANHSTPIDLGRQGENLARIIDIDISAWRAEFGEGTVQLLHQRSGDSAPYPAAVEQVGDVVRWAITSADTARVGYGAAQLLFFAAGDVLAKQCIYRTYVSPSLGQSVGEPPEAQQPWVERVLAEAAKVTGMTARAVELPAGAEPTADYADGILTIGIPLGGDVSEAQVAQAVADYLAAHPIQESDPTVPDWAKQPDKPAYTADEVGAISQTGLQAAVDTALAQAKASGAFDGAPGVGIQSVVQTTEATDDGGTNVITVTKTDGTTSTFAVRNGSRGSVGTAGADGKSAYQYAQDGGYTGTQEEFAAKLAEDHIPVPATAEVGQTIVVKAVDENGKPTEWEAADFPDGNAMAIIQSYTISDSDVMRIDFTGLNLSEFELVIDSPKVTGTALHSSADIYINGLSGGHKPITIPNYAVFSTINRKVIVKATKNGGIETLIAAQAIATVDEFNKTDLYKSIAFTCREQITEIHLVLTGTDIYFNAGSVVTLRGRKAV